MDRALVDLLACPLTGGRLEPWSAHGNSDDMSYGVLRSDAADYPVVEGIPVMVPGFDEVVALVRAGRHDEALVRMVVHAIPRGGAGRILETLASIRSIRPFASRLLHHDDVRRHRAARRALDDRSPGALVRYEYLDSAARSVDAYDYFALRAATPRYLVALSCIEAVPDRADAVLDVGCGPGHVTWALSERVRPRPVVGVDANFLMALTARRDTAPAGAFVCGDATALPFADGAFDAALVTDVLTFIDRRRTAVAELDRVLGPRGWCAMTSLHNARDGNTYTHRPVPLEAWRRLVAGFAHGVVSDVTLIERYRQGLGLPGGRGHDRHDGDDTGRVTLVMARDEKDLAAGGSFAEWPHARGVLHVNPLFEETERSARGVAYRRRFPSDVFRADNVPVADYLPERAVVSHAALYALAEGHMTDEVRDLLASFVVLGGPGPPWPRR